MSLTAFPCQLLQLETLQTTLEEQTTSFRIKLEAAEKERQKLMQSVRDGTTSRQRHYTQMLEEARVAEEKARAEASGLKTQNESHKAEIARLKRELAAAAFEVEVRLAAWRYRVGVSVALRPRRQPHLPCSSFPCRTPSGWSTRMSTK